MKKLLLCTAIILLSFLSFNAKAKYFEEIRIDAPDEFNYQPVDVRVEFRNPCIAIDEKKHSIRVFYNGKEIESQIHSMERIDEKYIKACNIVFLYQGKGKYLVEYGENIADISYIDHVDIKDSFYYVEPVKNYYARINYYEVIEEKKPVFGICQEGSIIGIEMSNKVIKVKEGADRFEMKNWEQIFSFAFFYEGEKEIGSDEKLLAKEIIVDGNLMTKVAIESSSYDEKIKTRAIYTYYYSPTNEKRIFIQLKHECVERCRVDEKSENNGIYAYILFVKSRSKTIDELNMGEILPYIHLNGKNGVEEYEIETNPSSKEYKWILSSKDNIILGDQPWVFMDDKSKAYGFIFSPGEYAVKAAVKEEIKVPGVEVDGGGISVGRIKTGDIEEGVIYNGTVEFFYGGNENISREANSFFILAGYRNFYETEIYGGNENLYNVTIISHFRHSFPFYSYISAFFGINFSHLEVEIWNKTTIARSVMNFRKASFSLPPANYVVKIYSVSKEKKLIGYSAFSLNGDEKIHVFCSIPVKVEIKSEEGAKIKIFDRNGNLIEEILGSGKIFLPVLNKYRIQVLYNGFLIKEENIILFYRLKREYEINTYSIKFMIKDNLSLPCGISLNPILTSDEMIEKIYIEGKKEDKYYSFYDLPSGNYSFLINYKNITVRKEVKIPSSDVFTVFFPVEYEIKVKVYDRRGFPMDAKIFYERDGNEFSQNILPPAHYTIKVYNKNLIAKKDIFLNTDEEFKIITRNFSIWPYIPFILISAIFIFRRKFDFSTISTITISLSFALPWWHSSQTKLYIFLPQMIEYNDYYGEFIQLPSIFSKFLIFSLLAIIASIIFLFLKKFVFSSLSISASLIAYSLLIWKFSDILKLKEGAFGIGFYLAFASFILIVIKVIMDEFGRRS
ncbi:MAG: hypothetical protein H5T45_03555 [Thermoplasmatales archaeon]|nr:hypothetical protein [Thermoplasmatales archaeon]